MSGAMGKLFEEAVRGARYYRLQSCCWVAPLRPGVLLLGYFNLLLSLVLIVGVVSGSFAPTMKRVQEAFLDEASTTICVLCPTTELAFSVLLLCAMHREDVVLLRVYVYYGLAAIVTSLVVHSVLIGAISVLDIIVILINILYQAYMILLVRSAIVEIRLESAINKNSNWNNGRFIQYESNVSPVKMPDVETPPPDEPREPAPAKIPEQKQEITFKRVTRLKQEETRPKHEETSPNPEEIKPKLKETWLNQAEANPKLKDSLPKQQASGTKQVALGSKQEASGSKQEASGSKLVASGSKQEETRLETVDEDVKLETVEETAKKKRSTSKSICRTS